MFQNEHDQIDWLERAAIMEIDGQLPRKKAEIEAAKIIARQIADRNRKNATNAERRISGRE